MSKRLHFLGLVFLTLYFVLATVIVQRTYATTSGALWAFPGLRERSGASSPLRWSRRQLVGPPGASVEVGELEPCNALATPLDSTPE